MQFTVRYTGNGGDVTLAFSTIFLERSGGLVIAGSSTMDKWVLERLDDSAGGYYYKFVDHACTV
jgi:hypothetical protein